MIYKSTVCSKTMSYQTTATVKQFLLEQCECSFNVQKVHLVCSSKLCTFMDGPITYAWITGISILLKGSSLNQRLLKF